VRTEQQRPDVADDERTDQVRQREHRLEEALEARVAIEQDRQAQSHGVLDRHGADEEQHVVPQRGRDLRAQRVSGQDLLVVAESGEPRALGALPPEEAVVEGRAQRDDDQQAVQRQRRQAEGGGPACGGAVEAARGAPPQPRPSLYCVGSNHWSTPRWMWSAASSALHWPRTKFESPSEARSHAVGSPLEK